MVSGDKAGGDSATPVADTSCVGVLLSADVWMEYVKRCELEAARYAAVTVEMTAELVNSLSLPLDQPWTLAGSRQDQQEGQTTFTVASDVIQSPPGEAKPSEEPRSSEVRTGDDNPSDMRVHECFGYTPTSFSCRDDSNWQELKLASEGYAKKSSCHEEPAFRSSKLYRSLSSVLGEESLVTQTVEKNLDVADEPTHKGKIYDLVHSRFFHILSLLVIVTNTAFIIIGVNAAMLDASGESDAMYSSLHSEWSTAVDAGFLLFYTVELGLRLYAERLHFFFNDDAHFNVLDLLLVLFSLPSLVAALTSLTVYFNSQYLLALRGTRVFKLAKLVRMVRAMRFIRQLHLFTDILMECGKNLFWATLLILLVLLLFAIYFVQALETWVSVNWSPDVPEDIQTTRDEIEQMFGSVQLAMLTLGKAISGGSDWESCYALLAKTGWLNCAVCRSGDVDHSGALSREEFVRIMESEEVQQFFHTKGLDIKNTAHFFELMNSVTEGEEIELEYFVGSCLQVRGFATSIDLHLLAFQHKILAQKLAKFMHMASTVLHDLSGKSEALCSDMQVLRRTLPRSVELSGATSRHHVALQQTPKGGHRVADGVLLPHHFLISSSAESHCPEGSKCGL
eukprot:TRINITY_DN58080_c0_g1_i3.p1 TRINITY_DN58080_c0_g1~~TRINITY_DN58080_c0_g1_i3.p1  ORF type:complete len:622 (+),score=77.63 TRINITY_DN58080_c0_g1_i3:105-1970(+)